MTEFNYFIDRAFSLIVRIMREPIFIIFVLFVLLCISFVNFVIWLLGRLGQMKMLKKLGYKRPFHAFVPYAASYSLGWLASQYDSGKKKRKHAKSYLVVKLLVLLASAMAVVFVIGFLAVIKMNIHSNDNTVAYIFFFLTVGAGCLYGLLKAFIFVYRYILSYNIFRIFENKSGKMLTVLCLACRILFGIEITSAVYFFICGKVPTALRTSCPNYSLYVEDSLNAVFWQDRSPHNRETDFQYGAKGQRQPQYDPSPMSGYSMGDEKGFKEPASNGAQSTQDNVFSLQPSEIDRKLYMNAQSDFDDYTSSEN